MHAYVCAHVCVCVHVYIYVSGIYAHTCEHVCEARGNLGCLSWYSPSFKTGSLAGLERIYQVRLAIQAPVIHHLYLPVLGLQAFTTTPECLCFQVSSRGWDSGLYMFARQTLCQVSYPSSVFTIVPPPLQRHIPQWYTNFFL